MTQEEILFKLFETLKSKGFVHPVLDNTNWWRNQDKRNEAIKNNYHYVLLFDHKFAKFLWGDKPIQGVSRMAYEFHLVQMVESEKYLEYIEREYLNVLV